MTYTEEDIQIFRRMINSGKCGFIMCGDCPLTRKRCAEIEIKGHSNFLRKIVAEYEVTKALDELLQAKLVV